MPHDRSPNVERYLGAVGKTHFLLDTELHMWAGWVSARDLHPFSEKTRQWVEDNLLARPRWNVMPPSLKGELNRIRNELDKAKRTHSKPFPIRGLRIAPVDGSPALFSHLERIRGDLLRTVRKQVTDGYDTLLDEIGNKLRKTLAEELVELIMTGIPGKTELVEKFGLEWYALGIAQAPLSKKSEAVHSYGALLHAVVPDAAPPPSLHAS